MMIIGIAAKSYRKKVMMIIGIAEKSYRKKVNGSSGSQKKSDEVIIGIIGITAKS